MKWLCKKTYYQNKNFKGYEAKYRTDSKHVPRGGEYILLDDFETDYPKVVKLFDNYIVSEDMVRRKKERYRAQRKKDYLKQSEQNDLIFKTFRFLKAKGINLGPDGDEFVRAIQEVKNRYPKPVED